MMEAPGNRSFTVVSGVAERGVREPRSSLYRRLDGADPVGWEGLRSVAHLIQGPLRGQRLAGACRSEGSVGREHVPDRLREAAGQVDLGDLGAALTAQAGLGAPVALGIDRMPGGMHSGLDQRPAQILRSVLGQRAAVVFAPGLVDPRTQSGVAG